jgi:hypothetical protein
MNRLKVTTQTTAPRELLVTGGADPIVVDVVTFEISISSARHIIAGGIGGKELGTKERSVVPNPAGLGKRWS